MPRTMEGLTLAEKASSRFSKLRWLYPSSPYAPCAWAAVAVSATAAMATTLPRCFMKPTVQNGEECHPREGNTVLESLEEGVVPATWRKHGIRLSHSVSRAGPTARKKTRPPEGGLVAGSKRVSELHAGAQRETGVFHTAAAVVGHVVRVDRDLPVVERGPVGQVAEARAIGQPGAAVGPAVAADAGAGVDQTEAAKHLHVAQLQPWFGIDADHGAGADVVGRTEVAGGATPAQTQAQHVFGGQLGVVVVAHDAAQHDGFGGNAVIRDLVAQQAQAQLAVQPLVFQAL